MEVACVWEDRWDVFWEQRGFLVPVPVTYLVSTVKHYSTLIL